MHSAPKATPARKQYKIRALPLEPVFKLLMDSNRLQKKASKSPDCQKKCQKIWFSPARRPPPCHYSGSRRSLRINAPFHARFRMETLCQNSGFISFGAGACFIFKTVKRAARRASIPRIRKQRRFCSAPKFKRSNNRCLIWLWRRCNWRRLIPCW